MTDTVLVAIITAVGAVVAAGITAYFTHLANIKKQTSSEVSEKKGTIFILNPSDGDEIIVSANESKPIDRTFSGKITGFSKNEIDDLGLLVEILVHTDTWYKQGREPAKVQNTGLWAFDHVKLGGTSHIIKAILKDKYSAERAKACEINLTVLQPITKRIASVELNVRVRPGANEPILTKLNQGVSVQTFNEISEVEGSVWVKIYADSTEGWVNGRFLK